ncbi:GNAT family N-acetyltransferase [Paracoccus thiocyanatus]|uniref:GNAT family N-acetyltransferase n=1 Tax=Paracoccus thiocyanatus TaxID=34006 RepID=UPI0011C04A87|nr:GNAT family N-acetyltransferase [Paracoccus thiocyanatus]
MSNHELSMIRTPSHPLVAPRAVSVASWSVWSELRHLEGVYPGFYSWYWGKVVPGLSDGSRKILTSTAGGALSGIVIAKSQNEKKICTVWVPREFRGRSIARDLMQDALDWLGTKKPLFTVPGARMHEFAGLVRDLGFEYRSTESDYYGIGRIEHVFNGVLKAPLHA